MKKTLIALALVALPVASMADVILYGQIKGGVEVTKVKGVDGTDTRIVDYGSRIGFKGHEHLGGNLQAIWQLEQSVNIGGASAGFSTRDSFVGLKGDFGTVKAGYQSTPTKDRDDLDIWDYDSSLAGLGVFYRSNLANNRYTAISYQTPDFNGFSATAYVAPSANVNAKYKKDKATVDAARANNQALFANANKDYGVYGLALDYKNNGLFAGVAGTYVHGVEVYNTKNTKFEDKKGYRALAQVGYENDKFLAGLAYQYSQRVDYENTDDYAGNLNNAKSGHEVALTGAYNVDDKLRLKASAAAGFNFKKESGEKLGGNGKYYQGIVGADYALSKRTIVNGQVGYAQAGKKEEKVRAGTLSVGLKHKF